MTVDRRPLITDPWFLAALTVSLALLGGLGWLWFGRTETDRHGRRGFDVVRCSQCGEEHPFVESLIAAPCEACLVGVYRPEESSSGPRIRWDRVVGLALISFLVLSALAHVGVLRTRALRRRADEVLAQRLLYRCPICERKISYPLSKIGSVHVCSGCKTAFALPDVDEPEE